MAGLKQWEALQARWMRRFFLIPHITARVINNRLHTWKKHLLDGRLKHQTGSIRNSLAEKVIFQTFS